MTDPDDPASDPVAEVWDDLLADMDATAAEYDDEGWETLRLHPGDVTPLDGTYGDRVGLDVLVPDDEYRALDAWFEEGFAVDGYEVYRSATARAVFLLVVVRDEDHGRAVLFPAFYGLGEERARGLFRTAADAGRLHTYLRRISGDYVEFAHDDPDLFAPPEGVEWDPSADVPDVDGLLEGGPGDDDGV